MLALLRTMWCAHEERESILYPKGSVIYCSDPVIPASNPVAIATCHSCAMV